MTRTLAYFVAFSLISVFTACNKTPECNDHQYLEGEKCVCIAPYYGNECQLEDVCLTSFKDCSGYPCQESVCQCGEFLSGLSCNEWNFDNIDFINRAFVFEDVNLLTNPYGLSFNEIEFIESSDELKYFNLKFEANGISRSTSTFNNWSTMYAFNNQSNSLNLSTQKDQGWIPGNGDYSFMIIVNLDDAYKNDQGEMRLHFTGLIYYYQVELSRGGYKYYSKGNETLDFVLRPDN